MRSFYDYDPALRGSTGILFVGNQLLTLQRDGNTPNHPYELDFPGGFAEPGETPFEAYVREVREEVGIHIRHHDIHYVRIYSSPSHPDQTLYCAAARVPAGTKVHFGDEGLGYALMDPIDFLKDGRAWPIHQEQLSDYLAWRRALGLPLPGPHSMKKAA